MTTRIEHRFSPRMRTAGLATFVVSAVGVAAVFASIPGARDDGVSWSSIASTGLLLLGGMASCAALGAILRSTATSYMCDGCAFLVPSWAADTSPPRDRTPVGTGA